MNGRLFDRISFAVSHPAVSNFMRHLIDPDGRRLPIKLDTTSNGEFEPVPLSAANHAANRRAHESASQNAKRLGMSRRDFLVSACGAAICR